MSPSYRNPGASKGRRTSIIKLSALSLAIAVFSACSDDDNNNSSNSTSSASSSTSSTSSSTSSAVTSSSASSVAKAEGNIVDVAVANGNFTTLVTALQAAGLDDDLASEDGSFTVFAPTDDAFAALRDTMTEEEWNTLLASEDLAGILLYHVVSGEIDAAAAITASGSLVETLNGNNVAVDYDGETVMVGGASVLVPDVAATNGVIHAIDAVIMPPAGTITDLVVEGEQFSTLETAVTTAMLGDTLAGDGPFTVFAPTDAAFAKLGEETMSAVLADNDLLTNILTYHVVGDNALVSASQALGLQGQVAAMLNGEDADINLVDSSLYIDRAKISVTNVVATNGVIHVIDSVMKPDGVSAPDGDIVEILAEDANFSTLVSLVGTAGLGDALQGDGPLTVFAPSNAAFDALPDGTLDSLLADTAQLTDILQFHVFAGSADAATAVGAAGTSLTMLNGADAEVVLADGVLSIAGAAVIMTDIETSNGIIHVIDAVMLPSAE